MSISVNIAGSTYSIPEQGQSPPWGTDLTSLLQAIVNSINSTSGTADILLTTFNLSNNQSSASNITGAAFDVSQVRSFIFTYSIYRSTDSAELAEVGQLFGTYSSVSSTWDMSQQSGGSSGVTFTITDSGQTKYTSTNMSGTG